MEYRRLGRTGLRVSEVCMGTMTFGGVTNEAEAKKIFDRCLEDKYERALASMGITPAMLSAEAGHA